MRELIVESAMGKLKYTSLLIHKTWHSILLLLRKEVEWEGQGAIQELFLFQSIIQSISSLLVMLA